MARDLGLSVVSSASRQRDDPAQRPGDPCARQERYLIMHPRCGAGARCRTGFRRGRGRRCVGGPCDLDGGGAGAGR